MKTILIFTLNAALNLLLGLAVAAALGPAEYGVFAIASLAAILMATACFDWLRLSTTRYYAEAEGPEAQAVRSSLNVGYAFMAAFIVVAGLIVVATRWDVGLPPAILLAAIVAAIGNALFEYRTAIARAMFLDRSYAILIVVRAVASFVLMVGAGLYFKTTLAVLVAMSLGAALAILSARGAGAGFAPGAATSRSEQFQRFARYGFPIVAANVIYQLILLINRSVAASTLGYADSGQLSLATDLGIRLLLAIGAALDAYLFQLVVKKDAAEGRPAANAQIRNNMLIVGSILMLATLGYVVAQPAFVSLIVPQRFSADFAALSMVLAPGIALFCLVQFALSPIFQITSRTAPLTLVAAFSLIVDVAMIYLFPLPAGIAGFAIAHSVALAAGFVAAVLLARDARDCFPHAADVLRIAAAGAVTALALWPTRWIPQAWLSLACAGLFGPLLFAGLLWVLNLSGFRALLKSAVPEKLKRRRA